MADYVASDPAKAKAWLQNQSQEVILHTSVSSESSTFKHTSTTLVNTLHLRAVCLLNGKDGSNTEDDFPTENTKKGVQK